MPPKRKRPETNSGPARPAPHRPGDTALGQHDRGYDGGRGGRGSIGRNTRRSNPDRRDPSQSSYGGAAAPPAAAPAPVSPTFLRPSTSSSPAAPAPITAPATPLVAPPMALSPIQSGYEYTIITDERVGRWTKDGRQEVVEHGVQSRLDEDVTEVTMIFQELLHSVVDMRLAGADAGAVVKEIIGPYASEMDEEQTPVFDAQTLFLDTVSIFVDIESGSYQPQLRDFVVATETSPALMRQILDPEILQHLGLIRDSKIFAKIGIRQSTNLLYRQANYNLLREETEGYAKLITELFTVSHNKPPGSDTVKGTWEKVKGLIGTFDLDVGRVQDVVLDVFAALLIKSNRFYIKFLRDSSWWPQSQIRHTASGYAGGLPVWALPDHHDWQTGPEEEESLAAQRSSRDVAFWERARAVGIDAYFELGNRQLASAEEQQLASDAAEVDPGANVEQQWISITKTRPSPGNRVAAQLLGFKLGFYASEARDADDILPANLLYLAALLIKVGYISLTDLWPHLWPPDEDMEKIRAAKMKELEEKEMKNRPGGATNALMLAGALTDDMPSLNNTTGRRDATTSQTDAEKKRANDAGEDNKSKLPDPDDQKILLLKCLLTIGAIPEVLFIVGRYDWILQAHPDLVPLVHRILHHSVDTVYYQTRPVPSPSSEIPSKLMAEVDQTGVPKGSVKLGPPPARRVLRWPHPDKADTSEGNSYRFYWDEWTDNIPVCQTVDDIFTLCSTFVNVIGVNIGQDAALMAKLASIGRKSLADDPSTSNFERWQDLLRRLLVPALSLTDANSAVVNAIWGLLKQYPTPVRYTIYAEWYEGQISRLEPIRKAFSRTRLETLSTMKRLSLTNIPQMARSLAKTAFPSPGIVFKVALQQIESYSNLIEAFVECAKYFTDLGYDVLVWSVLSSLGAQRSRTQEDSVLLTSKWLQALSRFSGKVFERYSNMDPTPVIQYVNDQLFRGNSTDLLILKDLIASMGGVVSDVDFTDAQLRAMTGGKLLRRETLINLGDKRFESARSSQRLVRALVDTKLAGQILINVAQHRQCVIYQIPDESAHIKFLATQVDDTHQTLVQFLDLLRSSLDPEKFDSLVPDVIRLMKEYGLDVSLAFMIGRASLRPEIMGGKAPSSSSSTVKEDPTQMPGPKAVIDPSGDTIMDSASVTNNGSGPAPDATAGDENAVKMVSDRDGGNGSDVSSSLKLATSRKSDTLLAALQPVIEAIPTVVPKEIWTHLSPEFYVFFWSLQLGDLAFPIESYESETNRLKRQAEDVMKDRTDMSRPGMNRKNQLRRELQDRQQKISEESKQVLERHMKTRLHLVKQVSSWFPGTMAKANATSDAVLEQCILPRLQLSALDAEYSYRLLRFLHESQAPNFKLMSVYDRLFHQHRLRSMIFICTVREAEHLGRFLRLILGELSKWHGNKAAYEKEALGAKETQGKKTRNFLGFATAFDEEGKPTTFVEHDAFRDLLFRWHKNLNAALRSCLNGLEWMHIRNAMTILKAVIDYFPAITFMADQLLNQLKTISEREAASKTVSESEQGHRVDLSVTAQTAISELQRRKSRWILVQAFRPGNVSSRLTVLKTIISAATRKSADSKKTEESRDEQQKIPAGPAASASASALKSNQQANATTNTQSAAEVEDGEVKDMKENNTGAQQTGSVQNHLHKETEGARPAMPVSDSSRDTSDTQAAAAAAAPKPIPTSAGTNSKPATPKPANAVPASNSNAPTSASRGETGRGDTPKASTLPPGGHSLPSRPDLPNRPDVPFPRRITTDAFGQVRPDRREQPLPQDPRHVRESRDFRDRDGREPRGDQHGRDVRDMHGQQRDNGRDFRMPEAPRTERPPRDFSGPPDRRQLDQANGSREPPGRLPEREWQGRTEPPRWNDHGSPAERGDNSRQVRDRPPHGAGPTRVHDSRLPSAQDASPLPTNLPPLATQSQGGAPEPPINPERASIIFSETAAERPNPINPERPSIINEPHESVRSTRDAVRERASRTDSPRRSDHSASTSAQGEDGRDDRHGRHRHSDYQHSQPAAWDSQGEGRQHHGRGDRDGGGRTTADRPRENSSVSGLPQIRAPEQDQHGRLNHQDPNYGRLNAIPSVVEAPPGPPSGPRGRGGRNRIGSGPMNGPLPPPPPPPPLRTDNRFPGPDVMGPPSPADRHPPTGPSSSRNRRAPFDSPSGPLNSPTGVTGGGGVGTHADRMRHMGQQPMPGPPPSGVHPDRLNQISGAPPAAGPRSHSRPDLDRMAMGGPPPSRLSTVSTPDQPMAPSSLPVSAPTGPSGSSDRMRPGGRQLRGVQDILEKAQADSNGRSGGLSGSGRRVSSLGMRMSLAGSDAQILTGSSPVTTPVHERPDPVGPRRDASADRGGTMQQQQQRMPPPGAEQPIPTVGDSREGRGGMNGDNYGSESRDHERSSSSRREHHHRSERSGRPSRRSSREQSPERGRDVKDLRDHRDRRTASLGGGGGDGTRGREADAQPRRSGRDFAPGGAGNGRDMGRADLSGGNSSGAGRDMGHRSHRGDGPGGRNDILPFGPGSRNDAHGGGGRGNDEYGGGRATSGRNGPGAGGSTRETRSSRGAPGEERGELLPPPRAGDDRGRKRRSDGGGGMDSSTGGGGNHRDKRSRV